MQLRYSFPIFLVTAFVLAPGPSAARTLAVPDPYPTIQTAIDSAAAGDSVLVSPGTYVENLHTDGKELTLKSLGSPENTIIDGNQQGSVIWVTANAHIEGFTIQNGFAEYGGGGIRVESPTVDFINVKIVENILADNVAGYQSDSGWGGGVSLHNASDSMIEGNTFIRNFAGNSGGGLYSDLTIGNVVQNNRFESNGCHGCGGAIGGGLGTVVRNLILRNWADGGGGGICGVFVEVRLNTVAYNLIGNPVFSQGAGIHIAGGSPTIERNLVIFNGGPEGRGTGAGIRCGTGSGIADLRCNNAWSNDVDYLVLAGCDTTNGHNISVDPLFCDPENGNYSLQAGSPCSEAANPTCGQIGAFGVACPGTSVERATWGRLKQMFDRRGQ